MGYQGLPRMRGDPPPERRRIVDLKTSTPHARGSTFMGKQWFLSAVVYPACAGIHPAKKPFFQSYLSLPRMRGDPPQSLSLTKQGVLSTPHARGSTPFGAFAARPG